jgi:hypothetical protein
MNFRPIRRRKQPKRSAAPARPALQPACGCDRVLLEAQRVAEQVARARATG